MAETIANQDVSRVLGRLNEWYDRMAQAGLTFNDLQAPIDDPYFRERLADFWLSGATFESSDQVRAREIMGRHFFGIGDLIRYFREGFKFDNSPESEEYQRYMAEIPLTKQQLLKYSKTHLLFPGYKAFNINTILNILGDRFDSRDWRRNEPFVNKIHLKNRWYLLRFRPLPDSMNKTIDEQLAMLPEAEEVPSACVVVMGMAYYFFRNDHHFPNTPSENYRLNCADITSEKERVFIGFHGFIQQHIGIHEGFLLRGLAKHPELGLATMVKLPAS